LLWKYQLYIIIQLTSDASAPDWDCGYSYDNGNGGLWTDWYNCDGSCDG